MGKINKIIMDVPPLPELRQRQTKISNSTNSNGWGVVKQILSHDSNVGLGFSEPNFKIWWHLLVYFDS